MGTARALACAAGLMVVSACGGGQRPGGDPTESAVEVLSALCDHRVDVAWEALPPSYRWDVEDVVHTFGARVEPEVYDQFFRLLARAAVVLRAQKDHVLGSDWFTELALDNPGARWDALVALVERLSTCELSTASSLRQLDVGAFLAGSGRELAEHYATVTQGTRADLGYWLGSARVGAVSVADDATTLRLAWNDSEWSDVRVTLVEGKWIPAEVSTVWKPAVQRIMTSLATMPLGRDPVSRAEFRDAIRYLGFALDEFESATTQQDFDATLDLARGVTSPRSVDQVASPPR